MPAVFVGPIRIFIVHAYPYSVYIYFYCVYFVWEASRDEKRQNQGAQ